jgi:myo-inosose-2 dehydratase
LKAAGSSVLVFADVSASVHGNLQRPLSARPHLKAGEWRDFARRVTQVAQMTAAQGVRLAYHHHMGTLVQSQEDIDTLMDSAGAAVGLLLDTGHAAFAGADPAVLARRYASRIWHVHAKDVRAVVCERARSGNWSFLRAVLEGVFTVPGDGSVDFAEVFRELRDYSGWVILEAEQDPRIADPMTYASLGYGNLRRLVSEYMQ